MHHLIISIIFHASRSRPSFIRSFTLPSTFKASIFQYLYHVTPLVINNGVVLFALYVIIYSHYIADFLSLCTPAASCWADEYKFHSAYSLVRRRAGFLLRRPLSLILSSYRGRRRYRKPDGCQYIKGTRHWHRREMSFQSLFMHTALRALIFFILSYLDLWFRADQILSPLYPGRCEYNAFMIPRFHTRKSRIFKVNERSTVVAQASTKHD